MKYLVSAGFSCAVLEDVIMACTLSFVLHASCTGFKWSGNRQPGLYITEFKAELISVMQIKRSPSVNLENSVGSVTSVAEVTEVAEVRGCRSLV